MKKKTKRLKADTDLASDLAPAGVYLPGEETLDLNKSEKLRTTALLMAINYVDTVICKDAEMYRALRQDGKQLVPATTPHVLRSAIQFEAFLRGKYSDELPAAIKLGVGVRVEEDEPTEPKDELADANTKLVESGE